MFLQFRGGIEAGVRMPVRLPCAPLAAWYAVSKFRPEVCA